MLTAQNTAFRVHFPVTSGQFHLVIPNLSPMFIVREEKHGNGSVCLGIGLDTQSTKLVEHVIGTENNAFNSSNVGLSVTACQAIHDHFWFIIVNLC